MSRWVKVFCMAEPSVGPGRVKAALEIDVAQRDRLVRTHIVLAGGQAGATTALLALSTAAAPGWPTCGLDLGSAGELMLDLSPASLLPLVAKAYAGSPLPVDVTVPPLDGLTGLTVHAQGALLAPADPLEPLRLTGALQVVLGGLE